MSPYLKDLIERVIRTLLASLFSGLATIAATTPATSGELKVAFFALGSTAITAAFGVMAKAFGSGDNASVLSTDDEYGIDDVE
jgi:hypothetical protein